MRFFRKYGFGLLCILAVLILIFDCIGFPNDEIIQKTIQYRGKVDDLEVEFNVYYNFEDFLENKASHVMVYNIKEEMENMEGLLFICGQLKIGENLKVYKCEIDLTKEDEGIIGGFPMVYGEDKVFPFIAYGWKGDVYENAFIRINEREPYIIKLSTKK